MEINNIIRKLIIRYPLFGNVIANLEFKFTTESVPAPAFTDGKYIFYRQEFIDDYSVDEQEFIVAHELFHIVFSHLFRNVGKDRDLLNYVEDGIINQLLIHDSLVMPEGLVNIPDAFDYSTEELYMKYLPYLDQIKKWMGDNTYHVENLNLEEWINKSYNKKIEDLMDENSNLKNEMLVDFQNELKKKAQFVGDTICQKLSSICVGQAPSFIAWKELLKANLVTQDEVITSYYNVEMDGIIKKEEKNDTTYSESEIIIDSSGSMNIAKIEAILRECKNILSTSQIRVGFCDTEFYGWNDINSDIDIDKLNIIGRYGTSFETMVKSFSNNVDNKIIITDGEDFFPEDCQGILWIIINYPALFEKPLRKDINYIFIDEKDIQVPNTVKSLCIKKNM